MNPKQLHTFDFSGMTVSQTNEAVTLNQEHYISSIHKLKSTKPSPEIFKKIRGQLMWCAHSTRPDVAYYAAKLSQVSADLVHIDDMRLLKKAISLLKTKKISLRYPKLNLNTSALAVYSDAGFATNSDHSSQLGFMVVLTDPSKRCCILHWNSYKGQRVTRSVLGAEVYAFCDAMDIAISFQIALKPILGRKLPVRMYTDSKSLFDTITKRSQTKEKHLLIDLATIRQAFRRKEIDNVGWVRSEFNLADALTKPTEATILDEIMETNMLNHPIEQ